MAEFKSINTQEEFDERIKERIERAEKKAREAFNGWMSPEQLKEHDAQASEAVKKLNAEHAEAIKKLNEAHAEEMKKYAGYDEKFTEQNAKIHALETTALKTRIANEKKLPFDAIEFLQGDDEEAIMQSAEKLSKLSAPAFSGITRNTESSGADASPWRDVAKSLPTHK